ncbi:glycoside hydrolase [Aureobasidium pullulans]|uniref:Glycoside hydrolase n=1 Tax=Aureobasidium pullulans TaxID=5580 RepID=A0A4S8VYU4_AURPU|nr:glycoside hydrolase [Aureobasidium pullulans]THY02145.1 glycoside hydrolase [Aureobasidium pullulans]THY16466.1 glycoside hydrolase [Aureobasidium pullulans]
MKSISSKRSLFAALACVPSVVAAQYGNATASANASTISFHDPTGVSTTFATKSFNYSLASTYSVQTDFSNERLAALWQQVGPIAAGSVTTTVSPTPESSPLARPGVMHPYIPSYEANLSNAKLPENFIWGVASSAYQIEGAANAEGKGPSIWDLLAHRVPNQVADNTTGDVVAEHYYLYKQDFARLKTLGVPVFSPSISWPRIFPFGKGPINEEGVHHYDDVVAELVKNGIKPAITLFHWDTPLALFNEYGAWTDPQIVDDFFNLATFIIQRYDQYVETWFTINEPQYCNWQYASYPAGKYYPAYNNVTGGLEARFLCGHYTLLAHARVAKWYHEDFKGRGRITFKNSANYFEPNTTSSADAVAVQRNYDFVLGWFNDPVWKDGDYPESLRQTLGDTLPTFTDEEKALVKGSCDFFALDGYTSFYASGIDDLEACTSNSSYPGYPECAGSQSTAPDGFPIGPSADGGANWLYSAPVGLRRFLKKITTELFPSVPDVMVTEFGFAEPGEAALSSLNTILWDLRRADYYQSYLDNILASIHYDGVNVTGAFGWAIFDNFEWGSGLNTRFGLQYVNYTSLERTPKASMFTFLNWFSQHI